MSRKEKNIMNKPLLVVLTPVRNEAWILHAFLKATSLWADYIIIADQMSTDGSREIYPQYEKVIVVDNPREEMHQARTRQLLFEAAKKIEGDKILFALDADEFLSGDFMSTSGWNTIINSEPGDVFFFRWIDLLPEAKRCIITEPLYWAVHMDDNVMNGTYPDNYIHEWRLPWPCKLNHEYIIEDIRFIHFAQVNEKRVKNKWRFYQVMTAAKLKKYGVKMYRQYRLHEIDESNAVEVPFGIYEYYLKNSLDLFSNLNMDDSGIHYDESVLDKIRQKGIKYFSKLSVWDDEFLNKYKLESPYSLIDRIMFFYLRKSNKYYKSIVIRMIDKILKKIY